MWVFVCRTSSEHLGAVQVNTQEGGGCVRFTEGRGQCTLCVGVGGRRICYFLKSSFNWAKSVVGVLCHFFGGWGCETGGSSKIHSARQSRQIGKVGNLC